jgi:hypothetical protein
MQSSKGQSSISHNVKAPIIKYDPTITAGWAMNAHREGQEEEEEEEADNCVIFYE